MDIDDSRSYPKERINRVKRVSNRAAYDYETVHGIVNSASVVHVSFVPPSPSGTYDDPSDRTPVVLPMIGQVAVYPDSEDDAPACYLHGHVSNRLMKLSTTAADTDTDVDAGLPVCVAATHVDGLVLSLTPFSHSYNYRSAVLHGTARPVEDAGEKLWAMALITDAVLPGRWDATRIPPTRAEMQSTRVLKVRIASASAKVRAHGPHDERRDLRDRELVGRVWTGVVPVFEGLGDPMPSTYNGVPTVPEDIREHVRRENMKRKNYAVRVAKGDDHDVEE